MIESSIEIGVCIACVNVPEGGGGSHHDNHTL